MVLESCVHGVRGTSADSKPLALHVQCLLVGPTLTLPPGLPVAERVTLLQLLLLRGVLLSWLGFVY